MPLNFDPFAVNKIDSPVWGYERRSSKAVQYYDEPCVMTVKYGVDVDFANRYNQTPYFSITADIVTKRGRDVAGGCLHDDIAKHFPNLAHLIRWHQFGMHYAADAEYWMLVHLGLKEYKEQRDKALDHFKKTIVFGTYHLDEQWLDNFLNALALEAARQDADRAKRLIKQFLELRRADVIDEYRSDLYWAGVFVPAGHPGYDDEIEAEVEPFSKTHNIVMTVKQQSSDYVETKVGGSVRMDKWQCTLRYDGRSKTFTFSLGEGHNGREPEIDEVLTAGISDAACVNNGESLPDFADNLGYDLQNGERTEAGKAYNGCKLERTKLIDLFGQELFDEMVEALG